MIAIENAIYQCRPPIKYAAVQRKKRDILHAYIRKTIYEDLNGDNIEDIIRRLRKLPWDATCFGHVLRTLANVVNVKFSNGMFHLLYTCVCLLS
jgi:hypothetical protein